MAKTIQAMAPLNQTLMVLAAEFGRTLRINDKDGRDRHMNAITCLLAGAGIEGGEADRGHPQQEPRGDTTLRSGPGHRVRPHAAD